jgi:hypothetical protein
MLWAARESPTRFCCRRLSVARAGTLTFSARVAAEAHTRVARSPPTNRDDAREVIASRGVPRCPPSTGVPARDLQSRRCRARRVYSVATAYTPGPPAQALCPLIMVREMLRAVGENADGVCADRGFCARSGPTYSGRQISVAT